MLILEDYMLKKMLIISIIKIACLLCKYISFILKFTKI